MGSDLRNRKWNGKKEEISPSFLIHHSKIWESSETTEKLFFPFLYLSSASWCHWALAPAVLRAPLTFSPPPWSTVFFQEPFPWLPKVFSYITYFDSSPYLVKRPIHPYSCSELDTGRKTTASNYFTVEWEWLKFHNFQWLICIVKMDDS